MSGFGLTKEEDVKMPRKKKYNLETQRSKIPTASSKAPEIKKPKCIFCDGKHASSDCFNVQKLTLEKKKGPWLDELKDLGVALTDTNVSCEPIQVLIGTDIMVRLLTAVWKL
ncbi:hypothetical protein AVEN_148348-1 [Araneus ventricosus]|uniref:Uncharacterized protein n=1 Tax=Araneus ventricosus TaxID=182803 RepID=A0A4Y2Q7S1_ARAVE|nr:hypothetical protein AVEN_148348-1 [Araneus ventricosus]